jgi:hypothetical protein
MTTTMTLKSVHNLMVQHADGQSAKFYGHIFKGDAADPSSWRAAVSQNKVWLKEKLIWSSTCLFAVTSSTLLRLTRSSLGPGGKQGSLSGTVLAAVTTVVPIMFITRRSR